MKMPLRGGPDPSGLKDYFFQLPQTPSALSLLQGLPCLKSHFSSPFPRAAGPAWLVSGGMTLSPHQGQLGSPRLRTPHNSWPTSLAQYFSFPFLSQELVLRRLWEKHPARSSLSHILLSGSLPATGFCLGLGCLYLHNLSSWATVKAKSKVYVSGMLNCSGKKSNVRTRIILFFCIFVCLTSFLSLNLSSLNFELMLFEERLLKSFTWCSK